MIAAAARLLKGMTSALQSSTSSGVSAVRFINGCNCGRKRLTALSPIWCAWLLNLSGNDYRWLFISAMVFVFAGSFFVLPIKSVR